MQEADNPLLEQVSQGWLRSHLSFLRLHKVQDSWALSLRRLGLGTFFGTWCDSGVLEVVVEGEMSDILRPPRNVGAEVPRAGYMVRDVKRQLSYIVVRLLRLA